MIGKVHRDELDRFVTHGDNICSQIMYLPEPEKTEAYTVYKDDEVRITAWVDYDYGFKIAKGNVKHVSGFHNRFEILLRKLED